MATRKAMLARSLTDRLSVRSRNTHAIPYGLMIANSAPNPNRKSPNERPVKNSVMRIQPSQSPAARRGISRSRQKIPAGLEEVAAADGAGEIDEDRGPSECVNGPRHRAPNGNQKIDQVRNTQFHQHRRQRTFVVEIPRKPLQNR